MSLHVFHGSLRALITLVSPLMNEISNPLVAEFEPIDPAKFKNPDLTALGEARASVSLSALETLWINTGTLCKDRKSVV